jgi:chromate transporter
LLTLAFAWVYERYGTTPQLESFLYGVKPVVIAVVVQAIWGLGAAISGQRLLLVVSGLAFALAITGFDELAVLLGFGVAVMAVSVVSASRGGSLLLVLPSAQDAIRRNVELASVFAAAVETYSPQTLFLQFLKIGATLYGGGYVLLSFLQEDFVEQLGWLTEQQLLDAVAVGQFTPGPLFATATFVGYLVGGWGGAALATVGIFLPSFVLVALTHPFIPRLRSSPWTAGFLDGVSAAAIGLMAAVTVVLGRAALVDPFTIALALLAAALLIRFRVNSAWLIVGGGVIGIIIRSAAV